MLKAVRKRRAIPCPSAARKRQPPSVELFSQIFWKKLLEVRIDKHQKWLLQEKPVLREVLVPSQTTSTRSSSSLCLCRVCVAARSVPASSHLSPHALYIPADPTDNRPGRESPSLSHTTGILQWHHWDKQECGGLILTWWDRLGGERVLNPVEENYIIGLGLICLGVKWAILDFFYEAIAEI